MQVKKYNFKEEKKKDIPELKEFLGMSNDSAEEEQEASPMIDDINLKIVYTKLLRDAKSKGVPTSRAVKLVDEIMNLYNTLVDTKYTFTVQTVLARSLKFFYNKIQ